jgi:hypothetical protein
MIPLAARQYHRMLDLVTALLRDMDTDDLAFRLAAQLNECLNGTATIFMDRFDVAAGNTAGVAWAPDEVAEIPWQDRARDYGAAHPLAQVFARDSDTGPLPVSDVAGTSAWRATSTYSSCREDLDGGIHHLALPLATPAGVATAFLVCRSGRDFTSAERAVAERVHPIIRGVDRHATEMRLLKQRLAAAERPPDPLPGGSAELGLTPPRTHRACDDRRGPHGRDNGTPARHLSAHRKQAPGEHVPQMWHP